MGDILFYIAALVFVIALIVLGSWAWRAMLEKGIALPGGQMFGAARDKRIGAVETASIDGRRKLILVRRDNVEHLILTGGPIDLVVETNIVPAPLVYAQPQPQAYMQPPAGAIDPRLYGAGRGPHDQRAYASEE